QQALGLLLFVNDVAVTIPGGGERFRTRIVQELAQHFSPSELAHDVVFKLGPFRPQGFLDGRQRNRDRNFTRAIERGMHDLLRGDRGLGENRGKSLPTGGLQNRGGKSQAVEIWKNQRILQNRRCLFQ